MRRGFTWIEGLVVLGLLVLAVGILLPALGASRRTARSIQNSTQVRGIHQSMMMYSRHNGPIGSSGFFPGRASDGAVVDATVAGRFKLLLDGNYFTSEYLITPVDSTKVLWEPGKGSFTAEHYSYAMLSITQSGGRLEEWAETLSTKAIVLGMRNSGENAADQVQSPWTEQPGDWRGEVTRNDNSTSFESSHIFDDLQYGSAAPTKDDNLFIADGPDDAYLIHDGQ